jgi:capsular exopolysaccharide synthesis family protein
VENQNTTNNIQGNFIDVKEIFKLLARNWHLFAFFLAVSLGIALIFYKYSPAKYRVGATVKINIQERAPQDQFGNLEGLRLAPPLKDFENELLVLRSSSIIEDVVKNLNLTTTYYVKDKYFKQEIYRFSPYFVELTEDHVQPIKTLFIIEILNETDFRIVMDKKHIEIYSYTDHSVVYELPEFELDETYRFGELIENPHMSFKIILNSEFDVNTALDRKYLFSLSALYDQIGTMQSTLEVEPAGEESTVAYVTITGNNIAKSIDFLNSLFENYIDRNLEKKNFLATNTIDYIEDQLASISDSLLFTEQQLQDFRRNYQVLDIAEKANRMYAQLDEYETQERDLERQHSYYRQIQEYFTRNMNSSDLLAPSSMGIEDPVINTLIGELTTANNERNTFIANNQQLSPAFATLNATIENLKTSISENIRYSISNTQVQLNEVRGRINLLNAEINKLPQRQRELIGIERQFNLNSEIYTYLLQKRAEAQIIKVSNLPDSEIIEFPKYHGKAFPDATVTFAFAIFMGLMIPIAIIFLRSFFNETVRTREDVERISPYPVLSEVLHHSSSVFQNVVSEFPLSPTTESFRSIRTSLILQSADRSSKVILLTSSINDEGKSFCSLNLATSFTSLKQPTVLVNLDMRKPDIFVDKLGTEPLVSIHSYLTENAKLNDLIINTEVPNLDYISSSEINADPVEMLASEKFAELMMRLKEYYSYIIIDTPPIGPVGDAFVVMQYSDINLYISRANYTNWKFMRKKLLELYQKKYENVHVILNDVRPKWLSGPSTYYTYTYGKSKKNILARIYGKLSKVKTASL